MFKLLRAHRLAGPGCLGDQSLALPGCIPRRRAATRRLLLAAFCAIWRADGDALCCAININYLAIKQARRAFDLGQQIELGQPASQPASVWLLLQTNRRRRRHRGQAANIRRQANFAWLAGPRRDPIGCAPGALGCALGCGDLDH